MTDLNPGSHTQPSLCIAGKTSGVPMVSFHEATPTLPQVVTSCPADEFDPDRFIDDRVKKYLVPNPFIFLPFNAGPRICLGQQVCFLPNPSSTSHADPVHPMRPFSLLITRCLSFSFGCCRTSTRSPLIWTHSHRGRRVYSSGGQRDEKLRGTCLQSISVCLRRLASTRMRADPHLTRL